MPKSVYQIIADELEEEILNSKLKPGDILLSENKLCSAYNVSRTTIRRSLALLLNDGYITSIPGKGYEVNKPGQNMFQFQFDELSALKAPIDDVKLISVEIVEASFDVALKIGTDINRKLINIKRMFIINNEPVAFDNKYIKYYTGIPIIEKEIGYITFPHLFNSKYYIKNLSEEITLYAKKADPYIASIFSMRIDIPITVVEQKISSLEDANEIIGWGITYYKADSFEINVKSM